MAKDAKEIVVKSWTEFVGYATHLDVGSPLESSYIFRGQAKADWPLIPSLVRHSITAKLDAEQTIEIEKAALKDFQAPAHLHLPPRMIYQRDELISWWVLMQHYNAPTRLLDWTNSPFVAAYFAVEAQLNHPGALWVVHPHTVKQYMAKTYPDSKLPRTPAESVNLLLNLEAKPVLFFGELLTLTDRMGAQQTRFTFSPQVLAKHGDLIAQAMPDQADIVVYSKLIIPGELKGDFMRKLRQMNITARALFPGVDGLGRSVAELVKLGAIYESDKREKRGGNE